MSNFLTVETGKREAKQEANKNFCRRQLDTNKALRQNTNKQTDQQNCTCLNKKD